MATATLRAEIARLRRAIETRAARRPPTEAPALPFAVWARAYLPGYFTLPPSGFHTWLEGELAALHTRRGTRLAVVAPRGAAKSTWACLAYPLWCAVHGHEPYIQLVSDTAGQAYLCLENVRHELEGNARLAEDYPAACGEGPVWRQDRLRLRNGAVIEALGTGSKLRGRRNRAERPTLIVLDDPENDEHTASQVRRERSWRWFTRALLNAGTSRTNVVALGTALHRECLVLRLQRQPGWGCRAFRAVTEWPRRMDLWAAWEELLHDREAPDREAAARAFYEARRAEMEDGAAVLWPEREGLYDLMTLRASIGRVAFNFEKQGEPTDPEACEFPPDYFDYPGFWFDTWPERLELTVLALDPSKGKDAKRGDYSAIIRYGRDRTGVEYVEADLQRRPVDQIIADAIEHLREFRPNGFAVEVNQFQELLAAELRREAQARQVDLPLYTINNGVNKAVRIRRLGPPLAQRLLRFKARSPGTALLVQQLQDFGSADFDDGPDALEMARRTAIDLYNKRCGPRPYRG